MGQQQFLVVIPSHQLNENQASNLLFVVFVFFTPITVRSSSGLNEFWQFNFIISTPYNSYIFLALLSLLLLLFLLLLVDSYIHTRVYDYVWIIVIFSLFVIRINLINFCATPHIYI